MDLKSEFSLILDKERENELVNLIKSLTKDQKSELIPFVKNLSKEYLEYKEVKSGSSITFKQKATPKQSRILHLASFLCLSRKDFEKIGTWSDVLEKKTLSPILQWYCPTWFNDYINGFGDKEWVPWHLKYDWIIELAEDGYLTPSKELLVKVIPQMIFEQGENHKSIYKPENLTKRKITLREHIWYLFELESTIHNSDRYLNFGDQSQGVENRWIEPLKSYSMSGLLDRERLLRESILATTRNFNKTLSGWFAELFANLEPSNAELLLIQKELLNTFNSPHSKPVNVALNSIKRLVDEPSFDFKSYLEGVPLLLASETKTVVSSTLLILDKLAKKHKPYAEEICAAACQALIHSDDDLQSKVAKLIVRHGDPTSSVIQAAIASYEPSLLMSSRALLDAFTKPGGSEVNAGPIPPDEKEIPTNATRSLIPIDPIDSIDEVIFLASQAFDNNKPYHIDLLASSLVNLQSAITGSIIVKLEPALQRAYKIIMNDWSSTMGYLDHLFATFFIDYTRLLIKEFPKEGQTLKAIHEEFKKKDEENKAKWPKYYTGRILELETWITQSRDTVYDLHKAILLEAYRKVESKDDYPLLSTPTHEPCFLDPIELINRLSKYVLANQAPNNIDFQLAISRCMVSDSEDALILNEKVLNGEYRSLIQFLLAKDQKAAGPFDNPSLWMQAGLRKAPEHIYGEFSKFSYTSIPRNYLTGQFGWKSFNEQYVLDRYDYQKKKNEKINAERKILRIQFDERKETITAPIKNLLAKWIRSSKEEHPLIFEQISLKAQHLSAEHNDIQRLLYLFPYNPEPLLAQVVGKAMVYNTFWSETDRKLVIKTLEALVNLEFRYDGMGHLFVATCMLSGDKTVRSFAAEIWINGVTKGTMSSEALGDILGIHESIEFAPLKRFTDLVSSNVLHVSSGHNVALEALLLSMLKRLPPEPVNNMKKLLESYYEVVSKNKSSVSSSLQNSLTTWKTSASLKNISTSLEALVT